MSYVCEAFKDECPVSVKLPKIRKDSSLKLLESTVPTPSQEDQPKMEYTVVDEIRVTPGNPVEDIRRGENRYEEIIPKPFLTARIGLDLIGACPPLS
jgi:hypothetical protein